MKQVSAQAKRVKRTRAHISRLAAETGIVRLSVHRTAKHIYAQIVDVNAAKVVAQASSLDKSLKQQDFGKGKVGVAKAVGERIAELAVKLGLKKVAFDRGGFKYHGRVKALAEAAREQGLEF